MGTITRPFFLAALAVTPAVAQQSGQRPPAPGDTVVCQVRQDMAPARDVFENMPIKPTKP